MPSLAGRPVALIDGLAPIDGLAIIDGTPPSRGEPSILGGMSVVGSRGLGGFSELVIGSTSRKLATHAASLVVRALLEAVGVREVPTSRQVLSALVRRAPDGHAG